MQWQKVTDAQSVREFVIEKTGKTPEEIKNILPFYRIQHFDEISQILMDTKSNGMTVKMVGDYDDDGVQSIVILCYLMSEMGIRYEIYMPKRITEGYGLSPKIVERMSDGGVLITIDNGIKAIEGIKMAKDKGMKVIVLDHHQAGPELPNADIIVDPSAIGEADYLHYCGAGLAYKLAEYILGSEHRIMPYLSVFAAIGTIGDCVELSGDNRKIVIEGLKNLKAGKLNLPMQLLINGSKISESSTAMDIAFNVVPSINAPGRLYDDGAKYAVMALTQNANAEKNIDWLLQVNKKRKELVEHYMNKIDLKALKTSDKRAIFLYDKEIAEGLIGIIAGKITEETTRPSFVFTDSLEDGYIKGSVRSNSDEYSIIEIIEKYPELYSKAGGHEKAAGLTIPVENFKKQEEMICKELPLAAPKDYIPYDLEIDPEHFMETAEEILSLEPTGEGNPAPIVRVRAMLTPDKNGNVYMTMGTKKEHVKFFCGDFSAIAFHSLVNPDEHPKFIDMIGRVTENIYKGNRNIQLILQDFRFY